MQYAGNTKEEGCETDFVQETCSLDIWILRVEHPEERRRDAHAAEDDQEKPSWDTWVGVFPETVEEGWEEGEIETEGDEREQVQFHRTYV